MKTLSLKYQDTESPKVQNLEEDFFEKSFYYVVATRILCLSQNFRFIFEIPLLCCNDTAPLFCFNFFQKFSKNPLIQVILQEDLKSPKTEGTFFNKEKSLYMGNMARRGILSYKLRKNSNGEFGKQCKWRAKLPFPQKWQAGHMARHLRKILRYAPVFLAC